MKRNAAVVLILAVVFGGLSWAGWHNYQRRKLAAANQPMQVVLVPTGQESGASGTSSDNPDSMDGLPDLRGKAAPDFSLSTVDGQKIALADYKGRVVLLNFWAEWCVPCQAEMPWLAEFQQKYAAQGLQIIGIAKDKPTKDQILKTVARSGVTYPLPLADKKIDAAYDIEYLPASFYIGRDGKVVEETSGMPSKDEIEANIKKALGQ